MPGRLLRQAGTLATLRRAWYLAVEDSRNDFVQDAWGHADFAQALEQNLTSLARKLSGGVYRPHELRYVDVPKNPLTMRPGSVVGIEDKIVLWAIATRIAPVLDRRLSDSVHSFRVRSNPTRDSFFDRGRIEAIPFLRRKTVMAKLAEFDEWFYAWKDYTAEIVAAFTGKGYSYLARSDISAYFENVDLDVLRSELLGDLPNDHDIVNLLIGVLRDWSWPAFSGTPSSRGIPQGNDISGFLGTFYLRPLDKEILKLGRRLSIFYARYVDDVTILAKSQSDGRTALVTMALALRGLRLNVQGSKTDIIEGSGRISQALVDPRMARMSPLAERIRSNPPIQPKSANAASRQLRAILFTKMRRSKDSHEKDDRLFRLAISAHRWMRHPGMVRSLLTRLESDPDSRMLSGALLYFRSLHTCSPSDAVRLLALAKRTDLFPYQRAQLLSILRVVGHEVSGLRSFAHHNLRTDASWYVRHESATMLATLPLNTTELRRLGDQFDNEEDLAVQRAIVTSLTQLEVRALRELVRNLGRSPEPELHRLALYLGDLMDDERQGKAKLRSLFKTRSESLILGRIHEVELLAKAKSGEVRRNSLRYLIEARRIARRPVTKLRIDWLGSHLGHDPSLRPLTRSEGVVPKSWRP